MEEIYIDLEKEKVGLQWLKIQLTYEQQAVKDAEAEFEVLKKRLWESKGESRRFHQMYREMLLRKKELVYSCSELSFIKLLLFFDLFDVDVV